MWHLGVEQGGFCFRPTDKDLSLRNHGRAALREAIRPDEAEAEDCGGPTFEAANDTLFMSDDASRVYDGQGTRIAHLVIDNHGRTQFWPMISPCEDTL